MDPKYFKEERMFKKILATVFVLIFSAVPLLAIDFSSTRLTGYEPHEVNLVIVDANKDPTLKIKKTLLAGINGVPPATEGRHVAKLNWTNETDFNIIVGHYWKDFTFDFNNTNFLYLDVYAAGDSALATDIGLWDQHWPWPFQWIGTDFAEFIKPGEWRSIPFYIGGLNMNDLDHIEVLAFVKLAGASGTIYLDNLRVSAAVGDCHCARRLIFSGHTWCVPQSTWQMGTGPNCYTDDQNDVFVDDNGWLHLSIKYKDESESPEPNWYCSEVIATENTGYGKYIYTVIGDTDLLDPNIVVGLFSYDVCDPGGYHEIDVELTRWGNPDDPTNAQFAVQPADPDTHPDNRRRFTIDYTPGWPRCKQLKYFFRPPFDTRFSCRLPLVTHEFSWKPTRIDFRSYYGDYRIHPRAKDMICSWSYTGPDIPEPAKNNPRINFYLTNGDPPQNSQDAEIVIKRFHYLPLDEHIW
jgi:hypothetical protein